MIKSQDPDIPKPAPFFQTLMALQVIAYYS